MTEIHWIDGDQLMEAIAAAVYERCKRIEGGLVTDDPRSIAVAAVTALRTQPLAGRAAGLHEAADMVKEMTFDGAYTVREVEAELRRTADRLPAAPSAPADGNLRDRIDEALRRAPAKELRADWTAPNGPLQITARVDDLADAVLVSLAPELDRLADYENRITWETTCGSCARILDSSIQDRERFEQADETHRLALSEALGLGTGAPWDAIHGRAGDVDRLQDKVLELDAEIAKLRDLLRVETKRANDAIDREETAEQAALETQAAGWLGAAAECNKAGSAYAERGAVDAAGAAFSLMETFRRKAAEAEYVATPCDPGGCEPGGEPCHTHERLAAHGEGDHELCGPDCGTSAAEAHPAEHTWAAELHDPIANEWVPGTRYITRDRAANHLAHASAIGPTWKDGTPTQRRLVRATTTYTVEPADQAQQAGEAGRG
ncbi:hypothetical protein ACWGNN_00745 [Streptomyces sp. NPDC055817]